MGRWRWWLCKSCGGGDYACGVVRCARDARNGWLGTEKLLVVVLGGWLRSGVAEREKAPMGVFKLRFFHSVLVLAVSSRAVSTTCWCLNVERGEVPCDSNRSAG